jgi:hypothetical protein
MTTLDPSDDQQYSKAQRITLLVSCICTCLLFTNSLGTLFPCGLSSCASTIALIMDSGYLG